MKPRIAITSRTYFSHDDKQFYHENMSYINYIKKAGGIPIIIPFVDEEDALQIAQDFDGLLLTGGQDVDPSFYHEINTDSVQTNIDCDASDQYLYHAFKQLHKPIFGICRGLQIIAAIEGCSILQDIPKALAVNHDQTKENPPIENFLPLHTNTFFKGTMCYEIFGESYGVNSFHHQAIKEVPHHFICASISKEDIIEAIEWINEDQYIIAVQWHPERMIDDAHHFALAQRFIERASLR